MALAARRPFQPPDRRQLPTQHGVVVCVVPGDHTIPIEIERAPDSGGSPGTYTQVHSSTFPKSGGFFTDYLPNDNATRWYRVRHGKGEIYGNASAYLTAFSAVPRQLREDPLASQSVAVAPFSRADDIGTDAVTTPKINTEAVTPTESQARSRCKATNSGAQTIANNTETVLSWDSESYDVGTLHSTSSNTSRITIPSGGNTGTWIFTAYVAWANNATGYRAHTIRKNGATFIADNGITNAGGVLATSVTVVGIDNAPSVGDYYEVYVTQTSGGNLDVSSSAFFTAVHVW